MKLAACYNGHMLFIPKPVLPKGSNLNIEIPKFGSPSGDPRNRYNVSITPNPGESDNIKSFQTFYRV